MKIGLVDLDTSHPQAWLPIERELGHEVVGAWDGGSVHPRGYAERFCRENGIPKVYTSLEEMAAEVDCAILHGCDWDTRIAKARPFISAGVALLCDKPVAGNLRDLRQVQQWIAQGARITGGSSLLFCRETREWLAQPVSERGTPHTVLCGCGVDEFNYGIHAYAMLSGILGGGVRSVQHLGHHVQQRVRVNWNDGRLGVLVIGETANWLPFYAAIATERCCYQYQANTAALYRALLQVALPYLAGQVAEPPLAPDIWLEPELCALAARQSWLQGGSEIELAALTANAPGYDGAAFAEQYRRAKYP